MSAEIAFHPDAQLWLDRLPTVFREVIVALSHRMLTDVPDVMATMVVGSLAEEVYDDHSDVDYLFVREQPLSREQILRVRADCSLIHLIWATPASLAAHFDNGTTVAWSVGRGRVLFDPQAVLTPYLRQPERRPSNDWIRSHAASIDARPDEDPNDRWRRLLGYAVLYLELNGLVPTTKAEIRLRFPEKTSDPLLLQGVELALLRARHKIELTGEQRDVLCHAEEKMRHLVHQLAEKDGAAPTPSPVRPDIPDGTTGRVQ